MNTGRISTSIGIALVHAAALGVELANAGKVLSTRDAVAEFGLSGLDKVRDLVLSWTGGIAPRGDAMAVITQAAQAAYLVRMLERKSEGT